MTTSNRMISRRHFLTSGVAAAVGVGSLGGPRQSPLKGSDLLAKSESSMRFGLATYTWGKDWDIPTLISNCDKAGVYGVELRTSSNYAHGVEVTLNAAQRAEVKQRFADSPVRVVSVACSERMDWPDRERLRTAVEAAKSHLKLSHDIGCDVLRVFPNQFHRDVPRERTIEQIARAVDQLGLLAVDLGQEVSLEAHGPAGELPTMRAIMDHVNLRCVRVRLNCDARDTQGQGFVANFNLVKDFLSRVIHIHDLADPKYPYQLMVDLLQKANWEGWALAERGDQVPDRVAALIEQRQVWEAMVEKARQQ